mmetsp:Transcript_19029/g.51581  ORF Transcript_19029/g.51581 Transcript_19029/m.51581 type:complete len:249 (+) Transcript_19029:1345-2091(+)
MNLRLSRGDHPSSTDHSASHSGAHRCSSSSITTRNVCRIEKSSPSSEPSPTAPHTAACSCAAVSCTARSRLAGSACAKPSRKASNCQPIESTRSRRTAASTYSPRERPGVSSSSSSAPKSASDSFRSAWIDCAACGSNSRSVAASATNSDPATSLRNSSSGSRTCSVARLQTVWPISQPAKRSRRIVSASSVADASNQWWRDSATYGRTGRSLGCASQPRSICCPTSAKSSFRGPCPSPCSQPPLSFE